MMKPERFKGRWRDRVGDVRVMCEPVEGYVLARHKGAAPFAVAVSALLNKTGHQFGPFERVDGTPGPTMRGGERP